MTAAASAFWVPVRWLDAARGAVLRALGPWLRPALVDRDKRAALTTALTAAVTLTGVILAPLWWLALAPLVWGVPHLLADVRYLLVRQGLLRQRAWLGVGFASVLAALLWLGVRATLTGCALLLVLPLAPLRKRLQTAVWVVPAAAAAWWAGVWSDVVLAHAHNLIGIAFWWLWRPQRSGWKWLPPLIVLAVSGLLLSPAADWLQQRAGGLVPPPDQVLWSGFLDSLGADGFWPGQLDGEASVWPMRLVLWFAFAQSMHYVMWLHLLPSDDRARPTPRSFRASLRAWAADVSWPLLALGALVTVGLLLTATVDLNLARDQYFVLAGAHGHVELLALLWIALRGVQRAGEA